MSTWSLGLLGAACLWIAAPTAAAAQAVSAPSPVFEFRAADFVLHDSDHPPGDAAGWQRVTLPDDWYVSRPGVSGVGWYRMQFELPPGRHSIHTIYVPRGSARRLVVLLNGARVGTGLIQGDARALNWDSPMRFAISPALLRDGRNVIHVRVDATADLRQGLATVTVGPGGTVTPMFFRRAALQVDSLRMFGGAALLVGLIAGVFWRRSRDLVMFWFAITAFAWAVMSVPWFGPQFGEWKLAGSLINFPLRFAYAAPLLVLCLRVGGRRSPAIESGIWLFTLCGAAVMPLAGEALQSRIITLWSVTYLVALVVLLVFLGVRAGKHAVSFRILVAGIALAAVLNFFDLGRWMGWLDYDNLTLTHFHVPLVLFAIGATIADRHFKAVAAVEHAKVELEHRVTETTREIAASYQRLREAEWERARALERNRIMADMHDGVGSSLLSLIGMIHSGKSERAAIERRAQEALLELRLAVDSLGPVDGDLDVVLGNVRHRMREAIENSSARFQWHVGELPRIDHLTPHGVLAIQRVLLEAITNALQHAQAKTITVRTHVGHAGRTLVIQVIDDGAGFDLAAVVRGRGLDNLHTRARAVGASVEIDSAVGRGTRVSFTLPLLPFEVLNRDSPLTE
jgi:signal transduction histidine kinase